MPLKKLFYFFPCFLFLEVVRLPVRTSIAVPWVRVSNAFYASLRLLKAGNSGGLPSLSLLVFRYFMSRNSSLESQAFVMRTSTGNRLLFYILPRINYIKIVVFFLCLALPV